MRHAKEDLADALRGGGGGGRVTTATRRRHAITGLGAAGHQP
jgi:hypothetical protein